MKKPEAAKVAETKSVSLKLLSCECKRCRQYMLDEGKPVPIGGSNRFERNEVSMIDLVATSYDSDSITCDGSNWITDEHRGKTVLIMNDDNEYIQAITVYSNNEDTLLLKRHIEPIDPTTKSDPRFTGMPRFRLWDKTGGSFEDVKSKLWDQNILFCSCGLQYEVDK